jgi:thiosulfate dehydrogenase
MHDSDFIVRRIQFCIAGVWVVLIFYGLVLVTFANPEILKSDEAGNSQLTPPVPNPTGNYWSPPDSTKLPESLEGRLVLYGYNLVAHTALYLGPQGTVMPVTNGMNCQNCHLNAGKKIFGNNYSAVASTYPKFRDRSGSVESIEKRVNDCIERSLNGKALKEDSEEMRAFVAYIKWVGSNVPKGTSPQGVGLMVPEFLERSADPKKGLIVFQESCARCHGSNGQGQKDDNGIEWRYPPLYGDESYNVGAGLFRLSRFAGYIKANMPNDVATFEKPALTDEQAWDVAAYINSMPRPEKDISSDWPDISKKPVDHPFGPYADNFSEAQHKYGPFKEMVSKK